MGKIKVMLVNDCRLEKKVMKEILTKLGYEVQLSNTFSIYNDMEFYKPDLLIANLIMKQLRGDELVQYLKNKYPNLIGMVCTNNEKLITDLNMEKLDGIIYTPIDVIRLNEIMKIQLQIKKKEHYVTCERCRNKIVNDIRYSVCPYCSKKLA